LISRKHKKGHEAGQQLSCTRDAARRERPAFKCVFHSMAHTVRACRQETCIAFRVLGAANDMSTDSRSKCQRLYAEFGNKHIFKADLPDEAAFVAHLDALATQLPKPVGTFEERLRLCERIQGPACYQSPTKEKNTMA
jgi:hypothetical protein